MTQSHGTTQTPIKKSWGDDFRFYDKAASFYKLHVKKAHKYFEEYFVDKDIYVDEVPTFPIEILLDGNEDSFAENWRETVPFFLYQWERIISTSYCPDAEIESITYKFPDFTDALAESSLLNRQLETEEL